jgi:hypothetical protein
VDIAPGVGGEGRGSNQEKIMSFIARLSSGIAVASFVFACSNPTSPTEPIQQPARSLQVQSDAAPAIPAWITSPETLPAGLRGRNDCTFAFGQEVPQWDFHSDAGCWERPGPEGWTRQQQHLIHVPNLARCGGGPGDVSPIRICRLGGAGQLSGCAENPTTGPNGCAVCVRKVECH